MGNRQRSAERLRDKVDSTGLVASIPFVLMAQAEQIDDGTITEHPGLFPAWAERIDYAAKAIVRGPDGELYRCVQAHTSQGGWTPDKTLALWTRIGDPAEEWPAWSQPIGAHDAYQVGDKVSHKGKHWISNAANNIWEPGVYGWVEAE